MKYRYQFQTFTKLEYYSNSGNTYLIDLKKKSCTCKWWTMNSKAIIEEKKKPCRHMKEILESVQIIAILEVIEQMKSRRKK